MVKVGNASRKPVLLKQLIQQLISTKVRNDSDKKLDTVVENKTVAGNSQQQQDEEGRTSDYKGW